MSVSTGELLIRCQARQISHTIEKEDAFIRPSTYVPRIMLPGLCTIEFSRRRLIFDEVILFSTGTMDDWTVS